MVIRGELVLAIVALALSTIAIASIFTGHLARWRTPVAAVGCAVAGLAPILLFASLGDTTAHGIARLEWSAVGQPTLPASYGFDGVRTRELAISGLDGA